MTHTSLMVKLLITSVFAVSFAYPQPVHNTHVSSAEVIVESVADVVATTTPTEVVEPKEEPVPEPKPETVSYGRDCSSYIELFQQYDWDVQTALQICKAESQGNPEAVNPNDVHKNSRGEVICVSSRGLMQIGCFWPSSLGYTMEDLMIPEKNIAMAYEIYKQSGNDFDPWTTYKR